MPTIRWQERAMVKPGRQTVRWNQFIVPVNSGEPPIQSRLMLMVGGAVFRQNAFAIRRKDRVDIRSMIGSGMLG